MFRLDVTRPTIIHRHHVELAAAGKLLHVAVQQDDGDAGPIQGLGDPPIDLIPPAGQFQHDGGKEYSRHLLLDVLPAKLFCLAVVAPRPIGRSVAPEKRQTVGLDGSGDLAADGIEDFRLPQLGYQQAQQLAADLRRQPNVGARPHATFQIARMFQVPQRPGDRWSGGVEPAHELCLAGDPRSGGILAADDRRVDILKDPAVFRFLYLVLYHGLVFQSARLEAV